MSDTHGYVDYMDKDERRLMENFLARCSDHIDEMERDELIEYIYGYRFISMKVAILVDRLFGGTHSRDREIDELKNRIQTCKSQRDYMESKVKSKLEEINDLQCELHDMKNTCKKYSCEIDSLKRTLESIRNLTN